MKLGLFSLVIGNAWLIASVFAEDFAALVAIIFGLAWLLCGGWMVVRRDM